MAGLIDRESPAVDQESLAWVLARHGWMLECFRPEDWLEVSPDHRVRSVEPSFTATRPVNGVIARQAGDSPERLLAAVQGWNAGRGVA